MGILGKIFNRREDLKWMFDYDVIEDLSNQAYVKRLALDSCIEFLAKAVAQSQFKVLKGYKSQMNDTYYKLNVKPNTDMSSDTFWQRVMYKLIYDNEVLIIVSDKKELLIADSFYRKEYALYDDIFESVEVKEYTFNRSFKMDEVIYLKFNNNQIMHLVESLFEDYGKIFGRMIDAQMKNYQIRGIVKTESSSMEKGQRELMNAFMKKMFKSFSENQIAIAPLTKGFDYEELSNGKSNNMAFNEMSDLLKDAIKNVALIIGIPPGLIYGETADLEKNMKIFEKFCLNPLLKKIENELNAKLYNRKEYLEGNRVVVIGVNKKSPLEHSEAIDKLVSSGSFTRNEVRIMLGEEPSDNPELDEYLVTKNYEKANENGSTLKGGDEK
ncbi:phage portal protein [Staphylococcus aureus]|uniref:phage portal protein n=1 Tax=Staphylococcus aureus TaxID=1280 RepID=UPI00215BD1FA|nr:phage portal protein [Staphylococcus aureus]UVJ09029.1 phage portal protein [Staphylococcus aureus]HDT6322118.1 phage portal protein [Staphylococcus aureus]